MSYRIGTISVTNGSKNVVGTNTLFATVGVSAGDQLTLVDANGLATGSIYEVASVTDDTHLTLLQNYQGTTGSGKAYAIIDMAGDSTVPNFARRLAQFYADIGEGASPTVKGLVKLYTALGSNTDGSITQAGLQTLFNGKANTATTYNKTEVDTALAGKANTATTLAGYGITDAINSSAINAANGVAGLNASGLVDVARRAGMNIIQGSFSVSLQPRSNTLATITLPGHGSQWLIVSFSRISVSLNTVMQMSCDGIEAKAPGTAGGGLCLCFVVGDTGTGANYTISAYKYADETYEQSGGYWAIELR